LSVVVVRADETLVAVAAVADIALERHLLVLVHTPLLLAVAVPHTRVLQANLPQHQVLEMLAPRQVRLV
jgi:hypothetical protein